MTNLIPFTPKDGDLVCYMGPKGDSGNGMRGRLELTVVWEDGSSDQFSDYEVTELVERAHLPRLLVVRR